MSSQHHLIKSINQFYKLHKQNTSVSLREVYHAIEANNQVVAAGLIREYQTSEQSNIALLRSIYVSPFYRGLGYGTALISTLLEKANHREIYILCEPHLTGYYQRFGFTNSTELIEVRLIQNQQKKGLTLMVRPLLKVK